MTNQDLIEIANAKNRLDGIKDLNNEFLQHAKKNAVPQDVPSKLEFDASGLAVDCFGHKVSATPRAVRLPDGSFAMEYRFLVAIGDESHEIWRFYLGSNGRLLESLQPEQAICDFNNQYVAKQLCGRLLINALRSQLFAIAPKNGG